MREIGGGAGVVRVFESSIMKYLSSNCPFINEKNVSNKILILMI